MVDPTTGNEIDENVDVSFVNNLAHSWIQQVELYLNDKQIVELSTPFYTYKAFIENFLIIQRFFIFQEEIQIK